MLFDSIYRNQFGLQPAPTFHIIGSPDSGLPDQPYQPLPPGANGIGTPGSAPGAAPTAAPAAAPATGAPGAAPAAKPGGGIMDAIMKLLGGGGQGGAAGAGGAAAGQGLDIGQLLAMMGG